MTEAFCRRINKRADGADIVKHDLLNTRIVKVVKAVYFAHEVKLEAEDVVFFEQLTHVSEQRGAVARILKIIRGLVVAVWLTDHMPCFFKGQFDAKSGVDTYVSFENLGHGYIWVNGFNLGRYDSAGPQMTLYLPGHFLKDAENEIIILDIDPKGERKYVEFLDHEILEGESSILS